MAINVAAQSSSYRVGFAKRPCWYLRRVYNYYTESSYRVVGQFRIFFEHVIHFFNEIDQTNLYTTKRRFLKKRCGK